MVEGRSEVLNLLLQLLEELGLLAIWGGSGPGETPQPGLHALLGEII